MRKFANGRRQRGGVMILVALSGAVLIGFLGIVVDLGRLFVTRTELQSAMDACALAAAAELRPGLGDPLSIERAVSAGMTAGNRNSIGFQAASANVAPADILFSDRLSDNSTTFPFGYLPSVSASPATARYALCARSESGISTWFMQVLEGFLGKPPGTQAVGAWATATMMTSQLNCAIPLGLCKLPTTPATSPLDGLVVGQWMTSRLSESATGSFDWIDFTPPGGGANELAGILKGSGQCNLPSTGTQVGEQGNKEALTKAWNTRFGLYLGGDNATTAPPDYTGFAYTPTTWPSQFNAFNGTDGATQNFQAARSGHLTYQGIVPPGYRNSTTETLQTNGGDRRLATVPVVDCSSWAASNPQQVPVLAYACVLLLHPMSKDDDEVWLEYRGSAASAASPCSTSGVAGGTAGPMVPALVH